MVADNNAVALNDTTNLAAQLVEVGNAGLNSSLPNFFRVRQLLHVLCANNHISTEPGVLSRHQLHGLDVCAAATQPRRPRDRQDPVHALLPTPPQPQAASAQGWTSAGAEHPAHGPASQSKRNTAPCQSTSKLMLCDCYCVPSHCSNNVSWTVVINNARLHHQRIESLQKYWAHWGGQPPTCSTGLSTPSHCPARCPLPPGVA